MCNFSLFGPLNSGVAAGGSGVATSNATSTNIVKGQVMGVYIKYNDSPPAGTTDVTVATAGTTGYVPAQTIMAISNAATDVFKYPAAQQSNAADGTAITGAYTPIVICDKVKVTIAQANNGDNVDVWLLMRE